MSERAERKSWNAHEFEAAEFYRGAGGERMSPEDKAVYDAMLRGAAEAAARLEQARGSDEP